MNKNQNGSGHVAILLTVVLVLAVGIVGWRVMSSSDKTKPNANQSNSQQAQPSAAEPDIALQNIGLQNIDDLEVTNNAMREYKSQGLKGFYVFGDKLSGNRLNPNFEYASMRSGSKAVSSIDGIVAFIREQPETKDFEVFIQPKENSKWTVGYDHIVNVAVTKGSSIKAGDVIGEPAMQNNGLLRFEMQVNKDENGATTHICPTTLLAATAKDKVTSELTAVLGKWESVTGYELYDVAVQKPVGCIQTTLTPAQAEGR